MRPGRYCRQYKIGAKTILAGQVGVAHLAVGDRVIANAKSGIVNDIGGACDGYAGGSSKGVPTWIFGYA